MLGRLLKHELRATGRLMLPMLAALILLAGLADLSWRGLAADMESGLFRIVLNFIFVMFFIGMAAACVMVVVTVVLRFHRSVLGDEGYLTLTLPVSVHGIVWSKLLVGALWIVLTSLVAAVLFVFMVMNITGSSLAELWDAIQGDGLLRELGEAGVTSDLLLLGLEITAELLLSTLAGCLHFYAAMALGHCFSKDKVLLSIVFFIALSFAMRIIAGISASSGMELLFKATFPGNAESVPAALRGMVALAQRITLTACLTQLFHAAVYYILTVLSLKKWLNLA